MTFQIISNKTVPCTNCPYAINLGRLRYVAFKEEFSNGYYEGKCPKCGTETQYSADYIKTL